MTSITEFILARVAEDEEVARAAQGEAILQHQTGRWSFETIHDEYGPIPIVFAVADGGGKTQVANLEAAWEREQRGAHIARHDPSRVLAECEAMRKIVALLEAWDQDPEPYSPDYWAAPMWPVVYALAAIWSDHADYEEGWR